MRDADKKRLEVNESRPLVATKTRHAGGSLIAFAESDQIATKTNPDNDKANRKQRERWRFR